MNERTASYIAAALVDHAGRHVGAVFRGPTEEVTEFARSACDFEVDPELAVEALEILSVCGAATISTDPFAGDYMKIDRGAFDRFVGAALSELEQAERLAHRRDGNVDAVVDGQGYMKAERLLKYPVLNLYFEFGEGWLQQALQGIREDAEQSIPASDRVVDLDHNSPVAVKIGSALDELETRLKEDNDTGELTDDLRAAALEEVSHLKQRWSSAKIRVNSFVASTKSTLSWIGEKAATATVGELAKNLLKLILDFLA
ncbi:MAG: hypothetical protein KUG65_07590 [Sphingomonadaceae bacterium]|nr:hypothetical protein [Sphingomonadaceae bacterium]